MIDVDHLMTKDQYTLAQAEKEKILLNILKKQIKDNHYKNKHLASYYNKLKFDVNKIQGVDEIPPIPVQMFKMFDLKTCKSDDVVRELKSSSTTSQTPSRISINKITAFRQAEALRSTLKSYLGVKRRPFLVIDTKDVNVNTEDLVARGIAIRGISGFGKKITYVLDSDENGKLSLNIEKLKEFAQKHKDEEILVFGFTYIVWSVFKKELEKQDIDLSFKDVKMFHSGGWKKLIDQQVSKDTFSKNIAKIFSTKKENIIDFYGMAEQSGIIFPDCSARHKHAPDFADIILRDPLTMQEVKKGETGMIEILSSLSDSYPAQAVLTEDLGEYLGVDDCPCGKKGKYFVFKSRIKKTEIRGCGDTFAEKTQNAQIETYTESKERTITNLLDDKNGKSLDEIKTIIEKNRQGLYDIPIEAVIGIFNDYAKLLIKDQKTRSIEGIAYLSNWCRKSNLTQILNAGLSYPDAIDNPKDMGKFYIKAQPKGVVCQWIAGNIPTLALFSYIQSVLCRNGNIIRASKRNIDETKVLLELLKDAKFDHNGTIYTGKTILDATALVSFPSSDRTSNINMSLAADCKVMWGGSEAIDSIRTLPQKEHCSNIIFGPKYSFGIIDKETINDMSNGDVGFNVFENLVEDIITFEQGACSSPQVLFVEKSGKSINWVADKLAEMFLGKSEKNHKNELDFTKAAEIIKIRAEYGLSEDKDMIASKGNDWTILINKDIQLEEPIQSRTIFIKEVNDINDVIPLITRKIQTIGIAIKDEARHIKFAEDASYKGALRFTQFGQMNTNEMPWDGMLVLNHLVNWISIRK